MIRDYLSPDDDACPECEACSNDLPCDHCLRTGWDPEVLDIPAWLAARNQFAGDHGITCGWYRGDNFHGQQTTNGEQRLAVAPYIKETL